VYLCVGSINVCNILMYVFFVIHLREGDHTSGRNMQEIYSMYNILSYTYVHMLVLLLYLISTNVNKNPRYKIASKLLRLGSRCLLLTDRQTWRDWFSLVTNTLRTVVRRNANLPNIMLGILYQNTHFTALREVCISRTLNSKTGFKSALPQFFSVLQDSGRLMQ
jgi:hypothetical protein